MCVKGVACGMTSPLIRAAAGDKVSDWFSMKRVN